ncbi:hypothetical protein [Marinimicrobium alkaliphilum]|uniref:hypothetical protein n=1 Tax=Marinimicrobium alkaliphilum TaxID=2202654 RepID=UPI000DBAA0C2|nr:hypothetical protein [Marinimicrobium alkaliphilum]
MPTILIVSAIVLLVIALVSYAIINEALEKRRKQRKRLLTALSQRQRMFHDMLTTFPSGFLPKELHNLVCRVLLDTAEHLSRLEPKNATHLEAYRNYSEQLEASHNRPATAVGRLESANQANGVRKQLQELYRYVIQQSELGHFNKVQTQAYREQIKRLALQMSVETYALQARQAQQLGKFRLAIHYYTLARKLLFREDVNHDFQKQIADYDTRIKTLEKQARELADHGGEPKDSKVAAMDSEAQKEWERLGEEEAKWKKKNLYD